MCQPNTTLYINYTSISEKAVAPHSSTLAWKIPCMGEPGGLQFMGSQRVRYDWGTSFSLSCTGEGNGNPLQCSCLENPRDGGAWWAAVYGVTQSRTWLKQLSSSSSIHQYKIKKFFKRWNVSVSRYSLGYVHTGTSPCSVELYFFFNWGIIDM